MTEQIPSSHEQGHETPELILIQGSEQSRDIEPEKVSPEVRTFIAQSLKIDEDNLQWLRPSDIGSIVMLFETLVDRLPRHDPLNERELFRISHFMADQHSSQEISDATKNRFGASMHVSDVELEQEDVRELINRSLRARGARQFVSSALKMLQQEAEAELQTPAPASLGEVSNEGLLQQAPRSTRQEVTVLRPIEKSIQYVDEVADTKPVEFSKTESTQGTTEDEKAVETEAHLDLWEEIQARLLEVTGIDITPFMGAKERTQRPGKIQAECAEKIKEKIGYQLDQANRLGLFTIAQCTIPEIRRMGQLLGFKVEIDNKSNKTLRSHSLLSMNEVLANVHRRRPREVKEVERTLRQGFDRIASHFEVVAERAKNAPETQE